MPIDYQLLVEQSISRFADLVRQRRKLDSEITRLQGFLRSMTRRVHEPESSTPMAFDNIDLNGNPLGITKAVAQVLQIYKISLTAVLIRDLLPCVGFDTSRYKDPLTSIHVILKRLVISGQVTRVKLPEGQGFVWSSYSSDVNSITSRCKLSEKRSELGPEAI